MLLKIECELDKFTFIITIMVARLIVLFREEAQQESKPVRVSHIKRALGLKGGGLGEG